MRVAIISDVHGNLEALEEVLKAIDKIGVDRIYCLGDIVGYNPNPSECIALLKERGIVSIKGNHERGVLDLVPLYYFNDMARKAVMWTRSVLSHEDMEFLRGLPESTKLSSDIYMVHGSMRDPDGYILSELDAGREFYALEEAGGRILFFGHTHVQGAFVPSGSGMYFTRFSEIDLKGVSMALVNPGSVGQPRDMDPRAAFAIYDGSEGSIRFFRVEYPVDRVVERIKEVGLLGWLGERLKKGI